MSEKAKQDVITIVMYVLSQGCGETYCESFSPFNDKQTICGENKFICYRCKNRLKMIKRKLHK